MNVQIGAAEMCVMKDYLLSLLKHSQQLSLHYGNYGELYERRDDPVASVQKRSVISNSVGTQRP